MVNFLDQVRNIHGVGRNYVKHIEELGNATPSEPVLFSKSPCCLSQNSKVYLPSCLGDIHHELELVLRIGTAVAVGEWQDLSCVSHMALGIDFTARQKQLELKNMGLPWHLSKNFADACFLGPLSDVFDCAVPLLFSLEVNDETRQQGDSSHMIFPYSRLLAFINKTLPLMEGDLIYTGTPAGVGPVAEGDLLRLICPKLQTDTCLTIHFRS